MNSSRVGFIGLGNMGILMARALVRSGTPLTVYDLRQEAVAEMQAMGAISARSSREVAESCDIIFSIVRDEAQTDEVVFGKDGLWQKIRPGSVFIISSTVSPKYCRELYTKAKEKGFQVLDAAVSTESRNFTPGQESAVFTLMVGGDKDAVEKCQPVFRALTRNVFYQGESGMGAACKLVNNLAMYGNTMVARECLNLGLKAGLDLNQMVEAMRVSTGSSRGLSQAVRLLRQPRRENPKVRGKQVKSLDDKDNEAAIELAEAAGAQTPIARFMFELDVKKVYDAFK
jgi:3-hydroxyisobutyrate dehydrogenase-like beta-hydroxyacid dehydrogenase